MIILGLLVTLIYSYLSNHEASLVVETASAEPAMISKSSSQTSVSNFQQHRLTQSETAQDSSDIQSKGDLTLVGVANVEGPLATDSLSSENSAVENVKGETVILEKKWVFNKHKDCEQCPTMVTLPAGHFLMGSNEGEENEKPPHQVQVESFYISETEVTFNQWEACYNEGGCSYLPDDNGWGRDVRPVINVSWQDAKEYTQWLRKKTGIRYRLPSEAEWEYAARAGSAKKYTTGDEITCEQARYGTFSGDCDGTHMTLPVGSYSANDFYLYDMHGNVWEWVEDCYHSDYYGAPKKGTVWKGSEDCRRVLRGGSWFVNADNLRSAYRLYNAPSVRIYSLGFRVARN